MTILDAIVAEKRKHVDDCKKLVPLDELLKKSFFQRDTLSLKERLMKDNSTGIISEFKRKSPSKGIINDKFSADQITKAYEMTGVAGVSILTDTPFFGGTSEDLISSRERLNIPILRKDFIIDEYQIFEAKAMGADVILLIAAILEPKQISTLAKLAVSLGLEILFEVHDREELQKLCPELTFVGVNNRNLKTFQVDIQQSVELSALIPDSFLKVSESGIEKPETILKLSGYGYKGFLIGESFMKTGNPGQACKEFIDYLKK